MRVTARTTALAAVAALATVAALAAGCSSPASPRRAEAPTVAAVGRLPASLATAAGARRVTVATADDLATLAGADLVVYPQQSDVGAERIRAAAGPRATLLPVTARVTVAEVTTDVTRLADALGTGEVARRWLAGFTDEYAAQSHHLHDLAPIPPWTAVVETGLADWAALAGITVVGVYRPASSTAAELAELAAVQPNLLLVDAAHAVEAPRIGAARPVALDAEPGAGLDLTALVRGNADRILTAFAT